MSGMMEVKTDGNGGVIVNRFVLSTLMITLIGFLAWISTAVVDIGKTVSSTNAQINNIVTTQTAQRRDFQDHVKLKCHREMCVEMEMVKRRIDGLEGR